MNHRVPLIVGSKFGILTVTGEAATRPHGRSGRMTRFANVVCECGVRKDVEFSTLRSGGTLSCGCRKRNPGTHGQTRTPLFHVWDSMKQRCLNPNNGAFARYGGRGITIFPEWVRSFEAYRDWVLGNLGEPSGLTIDRIDNDGNYEPGNLRLAAMKAQARNRSNNVSVTHPATGETLLACEWAERLGVKRATFYGRLRRWPLERALSTVG